MYPPGKWSRSPHPFCSRVKRDPLQTECSQQRDSVALCNLVLHERALPPLYQHFDWVPDAEPGTEGHYGGSVSLADYCPYTQEFTWRFRSVVVRGSRCSFSDNNPKPDKNFALESYGESSKCFDHTNRMWEQRSCRQVRQWQHWGSGCYEYRCEGGRLHIIVGNYSYECYHAGQEISVRIVRGDWLHRGALLCPPCKDLCHQQFQGRGEWCKAGDEAPPNTAYPRDTLQCGGSAGSARPNLRLHALAVAVSLGALLAVTGACLCSSTISRAIHGVTNFTEKRAARRREANDRHAMKLEDLKKSQFKLEEVVIKSDEPEYPIDGKELSPDDRMDDVIFCTDSSGNIQEVKRQTFEEAVRSALDKGLGIDNEDCDQYGELRCRDGAEGFDKSVYYSGRSKNSANEDENKKEDDTGKNKGKRKGSDSNRSSRRRHSPKSEKCLALLEQETPGYFALDAPTGSEAPVVVHSGGDRSLR